MYFGISDGELKCPTCEKQGEYLPLDRTILSAMRHIVYSEFQKLYSFEIPKDKAKILSDITGKYITVQTDHKFSTLEFYETIKE